MIDRLALELYEADGESVFTWVTLDPSSPVVQRYKTLARAAYESLTEEGRAERDARREVERIAQVACLIYLAASGKTRGADYEALPYRLRARFKQLARESVGVVSWWETEQERTRK